VLELDGLILDMDGVLWRGMEPMPGLVPFFDALRQQGIHFILATNNSTRTVAQYVDKLAGMGVEIRPDQVITSAYAAADYLLTLAAPGTPVYAVGEEGVTDALESRGFRVTAEGARFVVAGLDRHFTYEKMARAMQLILKGASYIGTNPDVTLPTPTDPFPGAGAILAGITAATGVEPMIVGKPEALMFQQAMARLGTRPEQTAIVGDRLETDILGGRNAGLRTILVLSGITQQDDLDVSPLQPDWVLEDIRALTAALLR
jgi:4-nitrophenyl phosphatase